MLLDFIHTPIQDLFFCKRLLEQPEMQIWGKHP